MNNILPTLQKRITVFKVNVIKTTARFLTWMIACVSAVQSQGQQAKGPVQLADQYFAAGEYYTAANLYEQFLHPSKKQKTISEFPLNIKAKRSVVSTPDVSRTDILFKQAESYRLANYWQQAATSYKECIEKDPSEYSNALYWYAVCERSLGHYDSAWESIKQYLSVAGSRSQYKEAAEKELQTLQFIHQQLARPDSVLMKTQKLNVSGSNEKGSFALAHVSGNQFLITSTQADSVRVDGINPYHSRLFSATLNNGSVDEMIPVTLSATDQMINQGAATISPDGKYLYFSQWKKENGKIVSVNLLFRQNKAHIGVRQPAFPVVNINTYSSKQPFCTTDGKYLFFSSDRPGGSGRFDIWCAPLRNDGTTGQPINLGPSVNTSDDEQAPFYQSSSGTLVFSSNGYTGMGGYDLFATKGSETNWKSPENLGYPVNSSRDDIYFFTPEKSNLLSSAMVSSDRGEGCCLETYAITKAPKNRRLTGSLFDCGDNTPLPDAQVILKDGYGKTWKTTTNANGRYSFEIGNEDHEPLALSASKESYLDTTSSFKVENIDESDLLIDKLTNSDLCIEKKPEPKPEPVLVIKAEDVVTVYFDFDKSLLKPEALNKLDSIYNVMVEFPVTTIQISGYTDGLGTEAYNKVLSDKRAKACADISYSKGN